MPPIKISSYDFNIGPIENLKANFLADRMAKNRWGNKFKRLYEKHDEATTDGRIGVYYFTAGMWATVRTLSEYETQLAAAQDFKTKLYNDLQVSDGTTFSIGFATAHSYMTVLLERTASTFFKTYTSEVRGMHFSLSLDTDSGDGRKVSWFRSSGVNDGTATQLLSLHNAAETYGVHLVSSDGLPYGHYDGGLRTGTAHNTVLGMYSVEDKLNTRFRTDQEARFDDVWAELLVYTHMMVAHLAPATVGERTSVMVGLGQLVDYVDRRIANLQAAIDSLENEQTRVADDMALINHLGIADTLQEEIRKPGDVEKIWFRLYKKMNLQTVIDMETGTEILDPAFEWWLDPMFDEIRAQVNDFHLYCVPFVGLFSEGIYLKQEVFELSGWKIFYFVSAFLDIDVEIEDPSFFESLINFILLIVSIVLTVVSSNPVWLKAALVTTAVLGYMGALSPELALAVAVLSFGYGMYSVDFSSMSGLEMFSWAIKNVSMVTDMVGMHESIGLQKELEEDAKHQNEKKSLSQMQDEAMQYIYSDAYSQYDDLYTLLYNFEPKYRT